MFFVSITYLPDVDMPLKYKNKMSLKLIPSIFALKQGYRIG